MSSLTKQNLKKFNNEHSDRESDLKSTTSRRSSVSRVSFKSKNSNRNKARRRKGASRATKAHVEKHLKLVRPQVMRLQQIAQQVEIAGKRVWTLKAVTNFFDVKDQKTDLSSLQKELDSIMKEIGLIKAAFAAGLNGKSVLIKLAIEQAVGVSSGGASQAPVYRIRPSDSAEFSSCATLFDEYKCIKATAHFRVAFDANTGVAVLPGPHMAMAYDPMDSSAYGSVVGPIVAEQHTGPLGFAAYLGMPYGAFTADGLYKHTSHMPKGAQVLTSSVATGSWVDTTVTVADYGYHKYHIEASTGAIKSYVQEITSMYTMFRCRT